MGERERDSRFNVITNVNVARLFKQNRLNSPKKARPDFFRDLQFLASCRSTDLLVGPKNEKAESRFFLKNLFCLEIDSIQICLVSLIKGKKIIVGFELLSVHRSLNFYLR